MQTPMESNYDGSSKKHKKTFSTNIKKTDFCGFFLIKSGVNAKGWTAIFWNNGILFLGIWHKMALNTKQQISNLGYIWFS